MNALRVFAWSFSLLVLLPGAWIALLVATPFHQISDWFKFSAFFYFAVPAYLALFTEPGRAHFTLWMPHPLTPIGWFLTFLFYGSLSLALTCLLVWVRRLMTKKGAT